MLDVLREKKKKKNVFSEKYHTSMRNHTIFDTWNNYSVYDAF